MKNIFISTLLLASAGAFADTAADSTLRNTATNSATTRAEVNAEYISTKPAGAELGLSDGPAVIIEDSAFGRSRASVRTEAVQEARAFKNHVQPF